MMRLGDERLGGVGARWLRRATALAEIGTHRYRAKTRRVLKRLNIGVFAVAISCLVYALTYAMEGGAHFAGPIAVNLILAAAALSVPAFHRINEIAGALFIAFMLIGGLFLLVAMMGRLSGIQLNLMATPAAAILIFEMRRRALVALIIVSAILLHVAAWILFPQGLVEANPTFLIHLYVTTVVTGSMIIGLLVFYGFWTAEKAEAETEALLHRILPEAVAERLKAHPGEPISDSFREAGVLFSDLAGFVPLARSLGAERTVQMLNHLVRRFDQLAAEHGVEKIKTIGDAYMAVSGLPRPEPDNAARLARMALRMHALADETAAEFGVVLHLRIGIAFGPVMAGIIGNQRFSYDVWGDAVNLAARLESTGEAGRIQVSRAFRDALADEFAFADRGPIDIKGVGVEETYFLLPVR